MKPWLEDLSEEWIPQPTPPSASQDANNPSTTQTSQSVPPKPRSRLPRLRHSSGSFSEIQVRYVAKDIRPPKQRSALAERSSSDNNIPPAGVSDGSDPAQPRCASRSFSASSLSSVLYDGTVAVKPTVPSPKKDQPIHDTPEWRRRLLKGDIGYGDQKDLFSPMGLENIFQKPHGASSEEVRPRKSKLDLLAGLNAMPSSPPPWPSGERAMDDRIDQREQRRAPNDARNQTEDEGHTEQDTAGASLSINVIDMDDNQGMPRTVSGQIEFENENFSPVYLSTNLKVGSAAKPIPNFNGSDLAHRLRHLGSPPSDSDVQLASEGDSVKQSRRQEGSSFAKAQDDTLPEDLPAGTPDLADVGRFVEMRRGGYSQDGSFRRRPLSPSPQAKVTMRSATGHEIASLSSMEGESQDMDDNGTVNIRSGAQGPQLSPVTPRRQGKSTYLSPERAQTSGSPLKLFDAHDTFTSNRLQRRLSQLEYKAEKTASSGSNPQSAKIVQDTAQLTSVEEVSIHKITIEHESGSPKLPHRIASRRVETFGQGQLDSYAFPDDFSGLSSQGSDDQESAPDSSPSIDVAPPGIRQPLRFHFDGSPQSRTSSKAKRQGLTRVSNALHNSTRPKPQSAPSVPNPNPQPEDVAESVYAEGKRGPTSPFKNPTPKRRRTLHSADDEDDVFNDTGLRSVKDSHVAMQSVIGRKRKDARHDNSLNLADPDVLARRHILRPRNPTPSQRRRDEIHAEIIEATDAFILSSPKMNTIREQLDSPTGSDAPSERARAAAVANQVAAFNIHRAQTMRDETRKRSVTTQDFLDEAVKIMDYIRTKGRPTSGLDSLEENEFESPDQEDQEDQHDLPSTPLTFSRPPSREGRLSAWREPNKHELDANVMSHLRKFQEKESDPFMGSSIRSLRFSRMRGPLSPEGNSVIVEQDNIRITDNLDRLNKDATYEEDGADSQPKTSGTQPSTASSMGQTVATSTSRRSEHVATLAPEAVAHLIPEQIAGMSFDREKNIWVRQKSPSKEHRPSEDISSSNETEEDPFGHIPDLTVDETAELMLKQHSPARPQPTAETFLEEEEEDQVVDDAQARPVTREGRAIPPADTSSAPSKVSNFAWSFPKTETRATSWSDQETRRGTSQKLQQLPTTYSIPESDEIDIEHEIKYFEGRGTATPAVTNAKIRDITFSIEQRDFAVAGEQQRHNSTPRRFGLQQLNYSNARQSSRPRKTAWRHVTGTKTLPQSSKPLMEEDGELSTLEDMPPRNYRMQLSMSVSAPVLAAQNHDALAIPPSSPAKGDVTFMLSELPEFTLHQADECELPDRVIVKHDGNQFSKALEDRYALGTAELIKALQDVAPDEPYWEDLREVNLHNKGLTNLHRLDEFCYRLEELDVSDNDISQVKGIPYTIRRLRAQNNCLTGLTSWGVLLNLQYLDVSGNDIDSLDGLGDLIHLRTLKVDDNRVTSLDGILNLDGLLVLSASGNQIEAVDFAKADMYVSPRVRLL